MSTTEEQAQNHEDRDPDHGKSRLHVLVFAPRFPEEPREFDWDKELLVSEAAAQAATAFGYTGGVPGLSKHEKVLDPTKRLPAAGIHDGDTLELLDKGGGV